MASARKPISDRDYLIQLEEQIGELRKGVSRLNRRLRDVRAAVHVTEDVLAGVATSIHDRLTEAESKGEARQE